MVTALIMVKAGAGKATEILDEVRTIDGIAEAHVVAGDYDLIVEFQAQEVYDVLETASTRVQGIDGVTDTRTYVSLED